MIGSRVGKPARWERESVGLGASGNRVPLRRPPAGPDPRPGHAAGRLRAVLRTLLALDTTQTPAATVAVIADAVGQAVPHDRFSLHTVDALGRVRTRFCRGDAVVQCHANEYLPLDGSIVGQVIRTGEAMIVRDAQQDSRSFYRGPRPPKDHLAALPLYAAGRVTGAIALGRSADPPFAAADLPILHMLADRAAAAVREADLIDALRGGNARLEALAEAGRRLAETLEPRELEQRIVAVALELAGADGSALWSRRRGSRLAGAAAPSPTLGPGPLRLAAHAGHPPAGLPRVLREGRAGAALGADDTAPSGAGRLPPADWLRLARAETLEGLIGLWRGAEEPLNPDDLVALQAFAYHAAMSLRNAALYAEARERAERDPLTALPNHAALHEHLARASSAAQRRGHAVAVLMLDMNGFKEINDTYGHQAGDAALCAVALALRGAARASDVVGRYGGDEFMAILPECGATGAAGFAERIRRLLANRPVPFPAALLSVSVGWAEFPEQAASARELVALADTALYADKRRQRRSHPPRHPQR